MKNKEKNQAHEELPSLSPYKEGIDDIDAYIQRFERVATARGWVREVDWADSLSAMFFFFFFFFLFYLGVHSSVITCSPMKPRAGMYRTILTVGMGFHCSYVPSST